MFRARPQKKAKDDQVPIWRGSALDIKQLVAGYGHIEALHGVDLQVSQGQLVAIVGANGAGKTTLLRSISGLIPSRSGSVRLMENDVTKEPPDKRVRAGMAQVLEGRQIFGPLSVEDNLRLGAYTCGSFAGERLERMFELFPILRDKRRLAAGILSGGQQQMLAIARALMSGPKVLLLDEPSMGLAPLLVREIFAAIKRLQQNGITVVMVEQNARAALAIADWGYVLETGAVTLSAPATDLLEDKRVQAAYLGL